MALKFARILIQKAKGEEHEFLLGFHGKEDLKIEKSSLMPFYMLTHFSKPI